MSVRKFLTVRSMVVVLSFLGLVAAVFLLPLQDRSSAASGLFSKTQSHADGVSNYDIRMDGNAREKIASYRLSAARSADDVATVRSRMAKGEQTLKQRLAGAKVEYNNDLGVAEVISPDVRLSKTFLTRPSRAKHSDILKGFLKQNIDLIGASDSQVDDLAQAADYTDPEGGLSFVELDQTINSIPVFRGEVKAGFTKTGEMIRVINNFAPGLDNSIVSTDFGDSANAVSAAALSIGADVSKMDTRRNNAASTESKQTFGTGDSATTAEKIYFPTEPGAAVPAWRVLVWQPVNAYYVIVDAHDGTVLWRKNITEDQTQPATYSVYTNPNAMINVAHSPFPLITMPTSPNGAQGTAISRTPVTRIGNEAPYTFDNLGWIPDGVTITDGNNVQAGLDRDGTDGIDPSSEASAADRNFTFSFNPLDPNTNTGDVPLPNPQTYPGNAYQQGAATQLFYICNWYHDETYRLGFTEAARNFQNVNFTGQGVGGDRVQAEAQDSIDTNNANFSTPADGGRGRMQMYLFTGPTPNLDGSLDADVVVHEHTHGLSNRLHGNSAGLVNDMSRSMGEGWSDFYALAMLSQPSDPIDGIYPAAEYASYLISTSFVNNGYYGIRRFPYAIKSALGSTGKPHNPLTFADIDSSKIDLSDGAFPPRFTKTADEVHAGGEIWCSALVEIRARMISRLGWDVGNRLVLQIVTDGMKLAPLSPTFLSERDAIVAAANAGGSAADVADVWAGFATRGIGASASIQNVGGTSIGGTGTTRVTEAFDLPNLNQSPDMTITEVTGNHDGYFDPGENLKITIPITNLTGNTATGVTLQVIGGGSADYGELVSGNTASRDVAYTVPSNAVCGSVIELTINVDSSLGPVSFTRTFAVGQPSVTFAENFDGVMPPAIPSGWVVSSSYGPMTWVSTSASADSDPNSMFAADLPNCTTGCGTTNGGSTELTSPVLTVNAAAATVTFRHKFNTEGGWDGGVLEIYNGTGGWQDIIAAGGAFVQNGYNGSMGVSAPNPLGGRAGWTGDSGGYVTTVVRLPTFTSFPANVQLRWRFGADSNGAPAGGGWNIDSIQFAGDFVCTTAAPVTYGDVSPRPDGDSQLLASDVIIERQFVVGIQTPNASEFLRADVAPRATHGDGVLTAGDTIQVRRYVAGLDPIEQTAATIEALSPSVARANKEALNVDSLFTRRTVRVVQAEQSPAGKIVLNVEMEGQGDEAAVGFTLGFDPVKLKNPVVRLGSGIFPGVVLTSNPAKSQAGQLAVLVDSNKALASGYIVTITFDVVASAAGQSTSVTFTDTITKDCTADGDGNLLPTRFVSGVVTILKRHRAR